MKVLLGDNDHIEYLGKTEVGNYISQEGIELQWSGEDEANAIFRLKMKGLSNALDNLKLGMGATLAAPFVIGGAIMAAPVVGSLGGFGTTLTGSSLLRSGLINAGTNALSQLATNGGSLKEIDGASVLISGFSGRFFKSKPVLNVVSTSLLDASVDVKLSGNVDYIGKKDWGEFGIDFGGSILNGALNNGMNQYPAAFEFLGTGIINTGANALQNGFKKLYND